MSMPEPDVYPRLVGTAPDPTPAATGDLEAAARRHPAIVVPLMAAALATVLGFSVTAYVYALRLAQAEALLVPEGYVPEFHRVSAVGRGLLVVSVLSAAAVVVLLLAARPLAALRARRTPVTGARLRSSVSRTGTGYGWAARSAALLAVVAVAGFAWLNLLALAAFSWHPSPVEVVWLVEETADTDEPVMVLTDDTGDVLLRPLTQVADRVYAPCGQVTRPAADAVGTLVLVEDFADELVGRDRCPS